MQQQDLRPLVQAAQRGGTEDADRLIEAVWPRAFRIAYSIVRDRGLAEDAAQEACAVLFRYVRRLRSADAFGVWFYRIVVRQAAALERRSTPCEDPLPVTSAGIDGTLLRLDIAGALAALSPAQRTCIALCFYAGMNSREIAAVLDMPDSSVRFHIMRGKQTLRQSLKSESSGVA